MYEYSEGKYLRLMLQLVIYRTPSRNHKFITRFGLLDTKRTEAGKCSIITFYKIYVGLIENVSKFSLYVVIENKMGYVDVKSSSGVYFYVNSLLEPVEDG